jgi:hypothetical protein
MEAQKWDGYDEAEAIVLVVADAVAAAIEGEVAVSVCGWGVCVEGFVFELRGTIDDAAVGIEDFKDAILQRIWEHVAIYGQCAVVGPEGFAVYFPEQLAGFAVHPLVDYVEQFRAEENIHPRKCDCYGATCDQGTRERHFCAKRPVAPTQAAKRHAAFSINVSACVSWIMYPMLRTVWMSLWGKSSSTFRRRRWM